MENERLTELFPMRLTPRLKQAVECEARSLGVRPVDVARMAIARAVAHHISPPSQLETIDPNETPESDAS